MTRKKTKPSTFPVPEPAKQLRFAHQSMGGEHIYGAAGGIIRVRLPDGSEVDVEMFQRVGEHGIEIRGVRGGTGGMSIRVEPIAGNAIRIGMKL